MILMEFLFAPTVPSAPRPQNLQLVVPSGVVTKGAPIRQRQVGHIIYDTDGESLRLGAVLINSNDLSRSGIFGTKTVTAGEDLSLVELAAL